MIFCTLFVVSMIIWIFFVKMFHDLKMTAFKFYFGSIGLFFILLFFFRTYLEQGFKILLFYSLLFLSNLTHIFYLNNLSDVIVNVNNLTYSVNFSLQASTFISMTVFKSLICFIPLLALKKRINLFFLGNILIFLINILKSFTVISLIKLFSTYSLVIDFDVIGKLIFFVLVIMLYYFIFTKAQIKNQKVGELLC